MTQLLDDVREEVLVIDTESGNHDKFQHYFPKKQLDENFLFGTPMTAICGKVVKQQVDPKGRPICQTCKDVYDQLPSGDE